MTEQQMLDLAVGLGFANAAAMDTKDLIFMPSFRPLCAENLCGKYGVNYACPPDCGTVEEMAARVRRWPRALVMQTMWDIEDPMDEAQTKPAKGTHNKMTRRLIDEAGMPGLMVGAGGCSLCSPSRCANSHISWRTFISMAKFSVLCPSIYLLNSSKTRTIPS